MLVTNNLSAYTIIKFPQVMYNSWRMYNNWWSVIWHSMSCSSSLLSWCLKCAMSVMLYNICAKIEFCDHILSFNVYNVNVNDGPLQMYMYSTNNTYFSNLPLQVTTLTITQSGHLLRVIGPVTYSSEICWNCCLSTNV